MTLHPAAQTFYEGYGYQSVFGSFRIIVSSAAKSFDIIGGDHSNGARVAAQSRLAASIGPNAPLSISNYMFVGCCFTHLFLNALHVLVESFD